MAKLLLTSLVLENVLNEVAGILVWGSRELVCLLGTRGSHRFVVTIEDHVRVTGTLAFDLVAWRNHSSWSSILGAGSVIPHSSSHTQVSSH